MADLNNLGLSEKAQADVDFDNMPTGIGGSIIEPPQPGIYKFRLPTAPVISGCFDKLVHPDQGERLVAVFRDDSALHNLTLDNHYNVRMTNVVRYLQRRGQDKPLAVSDLAQLLKAVGSIPTGHTNRAYAEALVAAAEREFVAESTLTANCSPSRDTYRPNPVTGRSEPSSIKGCGQRFRVDGYTPRTGPVVYSIPRDDHGKVLLRFSCPCGAEVRAWGSLQGIRPTK